MVIKLKVHKPAYHWCELSKERAPQVSPFCYGPCSWEMQRKPGCGLARRDADQRHLLQSWGPFPKLYQQQTMGLYTPGDRNDCISSSALPRETGLPNVLSGLKRLLNIYYVPGTEPDTGTTQLDSFWKLCSSLLVHGQLFSNRYSCFNPKGSHSLWIIKIET